jgi:hypothetical protein
MDVCFSDEPHSPVFHVWVDVDDDSKAWSMQSVGVHWAVLANAIAVTNECLSPAFMGYKLMRGSFGRQNFATCRLTSFSVMDGYDKMVCTFAGVGPPPSFLGYDPL